MSKNKIKREIIITIVVGLLLYTLFYFYNQRYENWEKVYTIGILKSTSAGYKSGISANYIFYLRNKIYEGSCGVGNYNPKIDRKYIVEIPKGHIDKNMMLFEFVVPDSIDAPYVAWEEIPAEIIEYNENR